MAQINDIHAKIGELGGRVTHIESSMDRVATALEAIAAHNARVEQLEKDSKQYSQRISHIENTCAASQVTLKQFKQHSETDTPFETLVGGYATKILLIIGGGAVAWILPKLPAIIRAIDRHAASSP